MSGEGKQGEKGKGGNHGSKFDANAKAKGESRSDKQEAGQKSKQAEAGRDDEEE